MTDFPPDIFPEPVLPEPLPPLVAIAGFVFILVNRSHAMGGLAVAAAIAISGTAIYLIRALRLKQWPFARPV